MTMDSLTFQDEEEYNRIRQLTEGKDRLPYGSEIEVSVPSSLNVEVCQSLDNKQPSKQRQKQLEKLMEYSIDENKQKIIIPITKSVATLKPSKFKRYSYKTGNILSYVGSVEVKSHFPIIDLGFSMTVHKAQGRTIKRVVLDLTQHPISANRMKYASIFVALSRVKSSAHMRLVRHGDITYEDSYEYLLSLEPLEYVSKYYKGFQPTSTDDDDGGGLIWNPNKALRHHKNNKQKKRL